MRELIKTILYQPLYNLLILFVWLVPGHSVGWAIILLTLLIRLILLPSSLKAMKAQVRLQQLQPKMNKIKAEIKDQQEQAKAMMALYKEEGVSPFGSCLPQLVQLPILFALYQVFMQGLDSTRFSLLYSFVPKPSAINTYFLGFNLAHPDPWILPILAGASQLLLSLMLLPKGAAQNFKTQDPSQMMIRQMTYIFPLMTIFIARSLPAALGLYWVATTLFSLAQQWYVNKTVRSEKRAPGEIGGAVVKGETDTGGPTKKVAKKDFMSRLVNRRLQKQERKSGVNITIRKKKS